MNSALTVPRSRLELALFGSSRYGLSNRIELSTSALMFLLLPQLELKYRAWQFGPAAIAARARVSYPTLFLEAVSKQGALGLLPDTTDPPHALVLEADALSSWSFAEHHLASLWLGVAAAPRETGSGLPLLDFPFLYPRFAALYSVAVPRAGAGLHGRIAGGAHYAAELRAYLMWLPYVHGAIAIEPSASLEFRFSEGLAAELGMRVSHAEYPIGWRSHFLPYVDFKAGF